MFLVDIIQQKFQFYIQVYINQYAWAAIATL